MIAEILANAVGGILSEVLGTVLKQPVKRVFDEYDLQRDLTAAVKRAEERFSGDYHNIDSELAAVLIAQTRFADILSVLPQRPYTCDVWRPKDVRMVSSTGNMLEARFALMIISHAGSNFFHPAA